LITAVYVAIQTENETIASVISEKISPRGIVISAEGWLFGYASVFTASDDFKWVIYNTGKAIGHDPFNFLHLKDLNHIYH